MTKQEVKHFFRKVRSLLKYPQLDMQLIGSSADSHMYLPECANLIGLKFVGGVGLADFSVNPE